MGKRPVKLKKILTGALVLLLILVATFLLKSFLCGKFDSVESLQAYLDTFGVWGPVILALIQALQVVLPVLPGFLGCAVGAGMFGVLGGFTANYIGISAGSIAAFLLARTFGSRLVGQMVPMEKYATFTAWLCRQKRYTLVLFLAILLPLAPDDFLCYFTGLTQMPVKKFVLIILMAKPWCILLYSVLFGRLA